MVQKVVKTNAARLFRLAQYVRGCATVSQCEQFSQNFRSFSGEIRDIPLRGSVVQQCGGVQQSVLHI